MATVLKKSAKFKTSRSPKSEPVRKLAGTAFPSSRWNFWEEGISSSLAGQFLSCREQFRLTVVEGWRSQYVPLSFSFGTCMHWCLEHAYKSKNPPTAKACKLLVSEYERVWKKERPNAPTRQLEVQELAYGLAEAMLPAYFVRWAGDFNGHEYPKRHNTARPKKWVGLETQFKIPYVFPDGKQTWIRGTRDAMFRTPKDNLRIFDTKCYSVINEEDMQATLPFNLQQMLYLWATWKEVKEFPVGTTMNIIRRPGHRRKSDESLSSFLKRVAKEVSDPKKWDHYFLRVEMDVAPDEIRNWQQTFLDPLMCEIRMWWEGKSPHFMNPNALITKYGRCGMFDMIVSGNTSNYFRRQAGSIMSYQTDVT